MLSAIRRYFAGPTQPPDEERAKLAAFIQTVDRDVLESLPVEVLRDIAGRVLDAAYRVNGE